MSNDSETFFIRFLMIDTTSDQDLRSISQKLRPTALLYVLRKVLHVRRAYVTRIMFGSSWNFFIRFVMIDTTSDQDLRSIAQKLCPTEHVQ